MQEKIFSLLLEQDEITWQSIINNLVKRGEIDPWDVDVSLLARKYLQALKKLKEMDFRISGKVVLASAILLKIKSNRLLGEDLRQFDQMFVTGNEDDAESMLYEEGGVDYGGSGAVGVNQQKIVPRTPQPRTRKISIGDLMTALEKAIEVKQRRLMRSIPPQPIVEPPKKGIDMSVIIKRVYNNIQNIFGRGAKKILFSELIPSPNKEDKVLTFIPLLHLDYQRKIDLMQRKHFGEIEIMLLKQRREAKEEIEQELGAA